MKLSESSVQSVRPCKEGFEWFKKHDLLNKDIPLNSTIRVSTIFEYNNITWLLRNSKFLYNNENILDYITKVELYKDDMVIYSFSIKSIHHDLFEHAYECTSNDNGNNNYNDIQRFAIVNANNGDYSYEQFAFYSDNHNYTEITDYIKIGNNYSQLKIVYTDKLNSNDIYENVTREYKYNDLGNILLYTKISNIDGTILYKSVNEYDHLNRLISVVSNTYAGTVSTKKYSYYGDTEHKTIWSSECIRSEESIIKQIAHLEELKIVGTCCEKMCESEPIIQCCEVEVEPNPVDICTVQIL